ncbi:transposable element Tc1 transposase [Trichonephila clavipes]|nr:transposable element Tc1 transposase [Trichonephila clavipes]
MGFGNRRPTIVPLLNARHRAARLAWTRKHRDWSVEDWKRVAWSDESQFRLLNTDGRLRIWRPAHEAMDLACQWRNGEHLGPTAKSGLGPPSWILQRALLGGLDLEGNRDYTGMWVRLGSTDLMAGKVMFLRSNQGGRLDGNESVADSFRSDLVNFKSSCTTILGAFYSFFVCQKNPPLPGSSPATRGQSHPNSGTENDSPPAKSGLGHQVGSYKGYVRVVSQAFGPLGMPMPCRYITQGSGYIEKLP